MRFHPPTRGVATTLLFVFVTPIPVLAQSSQARLIELREGKLQLPFLKNAAWIVDFTAAKAAATKENKLIFAYFTRSDERCPDSISMECGALAEPGFTELSQRVVPFCHITTKVKTDKDQGLFRAMGGVTYPYVVFMDATGKIVYKVKGEKLADFEKGFAELRELATLRQKVKAGDKEARFPLLKKELELGKIEFPAAKAKLKKMRRLPRAQKRELDQLMFDSEVLYRAEMTAPKLKARAKTGDRFLKMKEKHAREPTGDAMIPFWRHVMAYAELHRRPDLYEEALDTLKQEFPRMKFPEEDLVLRRLRSH